MPDLFPPVKAILRSPSHLALVAANLVPIPGVLFFGWSGWALLGIYFAETILVGVFNLFRMGWILAANPEANRDLEGVKGWMLLPFFVVHYGFFIFVQLTLFLGIGTEVDETLATWGAGTGTIPDLVGFLMASVSSEGGYFLIGLVASHLIAFVFDFALPGVYRTETSGRQMFQPYLRIIIQQAVVIVGGLLLMVLGSPLPVVVLLILLKTAGDLLGTRDWMDQLEAWKARLEARAQNDGSEL